MAVAAASGHCRPTTARVCARIAPNARHTGRLVGRGESMMSRGCIGACIMPVFFLRLRHRIDINVRLGRGGNHETVTKRNGLVCDKCTQKREEGSEICNHNDNMSSDEITTAQISHIDTIDTKTQNAKSERAIKESSALLLTIEPRSDAQFRDGSPTSRYETLYGHSARTSAYS